jgi:hypothetical protein
MYTRRIAVLRFLEIAVFRVPASVSAYPSRCIGALIHIRILGVDQVRYYTVQQNEQNKL